LFAVCSAAAAAARAGLVVTS